MGLIKMRDLPDAVWALHVNGVGGPREAFAIIEKVKTAHDVTRLAAALIEVCRLPGVLETLDRCGFTVRIDGREP